MAKVIGPNTTWDNPFRQDSSADSVPVASEADMQIIRAVRAAFPLEDASQVPSIILCKDEDPGDTPDLLKGWTKMREVTDTAALVDETISQPEPDDHAGKGNDTFPSSPP